MNCGIVGLPNVGKSTLFSALTSTEAEVANYPFCTIDPNVGVVAVEDERLDRIHALIPAEKKIPTFSEFVDIAGLVRGASQGEGLGNQFLSHIRKVGIIAHVVRCFDDPDVSHVHQVGDPRSDIETINTELILADLQSIERRLEKNSRQLKAADTKLRQEALAVQELLENVMVQLNEGNPVRMMNFADADAQRIRALFLLSAKKQIYVCNVDEAGLSGNSQSVEAVRRVAEAEKTEMLLLCGKLEADIAELDDPQDRATFLQEAHLESSGLNKLVRSAYNSLGLRTFFTAGGSENRAWTFQEGKSAPQCAGIIHSDFERGFIKADVFHCDDLFQLGSEAAVKSAGKLRMEGKNYTVRDGDILHFKFNV